MQGRKFRRPKYVLNKGEKFGFLTYTGRCNRVGEGRNARQLGDFVCDCGGCCSVRLDAVIKGNNRSCGCKSPNRDYKEKRKAIGEDYPYHVLVRVFQKNAKTRKIDFSLTAEDIKSLYMKQDGLCFYTKKKLTLPTNFLFINEPTVASIDRIDSSNGYVLGNVQLVYKKVNLMKSILSHQEFISLCQLISENFTISDDSTQL